MLTAEVLRPPAIKPESLKVLQENPRLLIPDRLRELVPGPIRAIPIPVTLGRMDEEYEPAISVLIVELAGFSVPVMVQETERDNSWWVALLNGWRQKAVGDGSICNQDKALVCLIAHSWGDGVQVMSYCEAEDLRRKGLGRAFYQNFENLLRQMGYRYICGVSYRRNIDFFLRMGRRKFEELHEGHDHLLPKEFWIGVPTIKFLDPQLEAEWVKPEFLRETAFARETI